MCCVSFLLEVACLNACVPAVTPAVACFGSAGDGWAFTLGQFAAMYAAKMGGNPRALQKVCAVAASQSAA